MKKLLAIYALLLLSIAYPQLAVAQPDDNPVQWKTTLEQISGDQFRVTFTASIRGQWHLYDLGPYVGGPNATTFTFTPNDKLIPVGKTQQSPEPTRVYDKLFAMEIGYYSRQATFSQVFRLTEPTQQTTLKTNVEWMVCDDTSCLPPTDQDFNTVIGPAKPGTGSNAASSLGSGSESDSGSDSASTAGIKTENSAITNTETGDSIAGGIDGSGAPTQGTLWGAIIEAILWGFAALLTPCVFPMVPMTVSFFMKSSQSRARGRLMASLYGLCIVLLYTLPIAIIILITNTAGGDAVTADIFNWLATHWIPNVIFFAVFMLFAASFFGAFEITMPSWLVNKSDSQADKGGIVGVFFMALTLVLVSFSCTGPIVGSVLIKSTSGEVWAPVVTMFAFSLAFALPFTLFAFFPSLLKNLPKSGGWLNSVKIVLGFLELALGLKFLSVADQTYHWGILDREIYLALWIVIFALLGSYLLGKLRFAHDSETKTISVPRLLLSIITFSFVVYMIPGMWGAPLRGLSGYLPPLHTQDFVLTPGSAPTSAQEYKKPAKYSDFLSLPLGLEGFFDYKEALAYAQKVGKPLFVDYTGHGCVNCREMEARVWSDPQVLELLRRDFVIVALYSDDKKEVPESDWITTPNGKVLKGLGKINAYFAHKTFNINSQPYYLILDRDGKPLLPGRGYNLNVNDFVRFLQEGIQQYQESEKRLM